ncbi:ABC transporter ATP-binding protein [Microvirga sp. W0021]|uniref:ABC transporter ATP-binding protein n=1 Tax=Hohaiivirga grylli TaxID=3133970 RepID=A0ABV0BIU0_9HYPH
MSAQVSDSFGAVTSLPLVELRGICKRYGDLLANNDIDLRINRGEIHALLGENGAGKSTLVKILYGAVEPSAGDILWEGKPIAMGSPVQARALGIGMVFQHFSLFDNLTVAENITVALGKDWTLQSVRTEIGKISADYGLSLEPDRKVWTLSAGERQRIEIVRCLLQNPKILILDEPTSVLTPQEADKLFETLEQLAAKGCAILYISHRLEEVRRICSSATILRAGKVIATLDPRRNSARDIAAMMVGIEVGNISPREHAPKESMLKLNKLALKSETIHEIALQDIDLEVHCGEIVGIAGVAGNGQSELFAALSGERLSRRGMVSIEERDCSLDGITTRRTLGAAFVPEERLGHAAAPHYTLSENTLISHRLDSNVVSKGMVSKEAARKLAGEIIRRFDVRVPNPDPEARMLSGGNLQKFVIGREIISKPRLLIVDQPTWGVDAGAAHMIRQALINLAAYGSAILVISQDLDELFEISDRIAVIHDGKLSTANATESWSREAIGLEMMGIGQEGKHS